MRSAAALSLTLLAAACTKPTGLARDTEGRGFELRCAPDASCKLTQTSGPSRSGRTLRLAPPGRVLAVCEVTDDADETPPPPEDCRALVCETERDCPPLPSGGTPQCVKGLCSDLLRPLTVRDAVMLCLAGMGLGRDGDAQMERYALGLHCGQPCRVPTQCRQP